jgi:hypothetical protein
MPVAAGTLFHFTKSLKNLHGIIENGFIPGLPQEDYSFLKSGLKLHIPMVCFCDIPLHLIDNHIYCYGSYGIGLSKDWGIKEGLNPIIYVADTPHSSRVYNLDSRCINSVLLETVTKNMPKTGNLSKTNYELLCYLKPYEGIDKRKKNKILYEENEWRYVPPVFGKKKNMMLFRELQKNQGIQEFTDKAEEALSEYPLKFTPESVQYIFIRKEKEREKAIDTFYKNSKLAESAIKLLCSKIISIEQIKGDV